MKESELYQRCDEALDDLLTSNGFSSSQPAEYFRTTEGGEDRIMVSRAAGSRSRTHFALWMSYYPDYLGILDDMVRHLGESRGFPCGPYLSPVGVIRREKYWSCRNATALEKSLSHVKQCLTDVGLPWLETLRDPIIFAESVDPAAVLIAGLAHEVAGNLDKAADYYREMYSRLSQVIPTSGERQFLNEFARPFVFVTAKLGIEQEKRKEYQRKLGYFPDIQRLNIGAR